MKKFVLVLSLVLIAVVLSGCTQQSPDSSIPTADDTLTGTDDSMMDDGAMDDSGAAAETHIIQITQEGFSPSPLTIKQGDTVIWENNTASTTRWPASAQHPTHTVYPGSGIEKCGTAEQPNIFDACGGVGPGESFSFTFNEKGEWFYHDHLDPTKFGQVIVE